MRSFFGLLRSVLWMCPLIGLSVVGMGTVSLFSSLFDKTGRLQHRVAVRWARMVLGICRVRVDVVGAGNLDPGKHYVFCSNHFSLIDTPLMFGCMPREFRILARHGLWKVPFLGWHLNRAGHLPVHRENPRVAARNIQQAADKIRDGFSVLIFPEGGRTREDRMRRFKPGAGYIAIGAQAPIVPMAIVGTRDILAPNSLHLRPGRAELRIGKPLPTEGLEQRDAKDLMERLRSQILELGSQPVK